MSSVQTLDDDALDTVTKIHGKDSATLKEKQEDDLKSNKERQAAKKRRRQQKVLKVNLDSATQESNASLAFCIAGRKFTAALKAKEGAEKAFKKASIVDKDDFVVAFKNLKIRNKPLATMIAAIAWLRDLQKYHLMASNMASNNWYIDSYTTLF